MYFKYNNFSRIAKEGSNTSNIYQYLPFSNIFGRVALFGDSVVNETEFASLSSWADSVQANVKLGTVICVRIFWMRIRKTQWISALNFRTGESVNRVSFVI